MKLLTSITYIVLFLLSLFTLPAFADSNEVSPAKKYISNLTANVPDISAEELKKLFKTDDEVVLLDVRTFYERDKTKTILGDKEIHIPRGFLEVKAWDRVPKDKTVIVYCSKGTRSKLAVKTLQEMGWENTTSLQGGVKGWYKSEDRPCGCLPEDKEIPNQKVESSNSEEGCSP